MKCVQVAIPLPVRDPFSYELNTEAAGDVGIGCRVRVPFKNREIQGYVVGFRDEADVKSIKPVLECLDREPVLDANFLELTRWIGEYYFCSWGEAIENALPKTVRAGIKHREGSAKVCDTGAPFRVTLNEEQEAVVAEIFPALEAGAHSTFLLHGVTGSGKTEVYIRAIKKTLDLGKSAICLVPEIALTDQIREFFRGHFGNLIEIIHSRLTDRERFFAWQRIRGGESRVVLGPRSAIFSPVKNLGMMIIDEEHEGSYKQEESPRYHARTVAWKRAELEKAVLLLGSATPSLETMHAAESGRIRKLELTRRIDERELPEVRIVDLKQEASNRGKSVAFSFPLIHEITQSLERKEGVLILLNRRGFSTQVHCLQCGGIVQCRHCQVALTYHQERGRLLCHYCNYQRRLDEACPSCRAAVLKYVGWGTEKVESEIARFFPQARIARLDLDIAKKKGKQEEVLGDFRKRKTDILVGTQMIAKGFDFPHVSMVGVISADVSLALPDFRSDERTFQLLTQVAGRAGRGNARGRVIFQTYSPHHPSILYAKEHDYRRFFDSEIEKRRELDYPPFCHLINVVIQGRDEKEVYGVSREFCSKLKGHREKLPFREILGPAPLPFYKLRGHFRWHVMLKGREVLGMNRFLREVLSDFRKPSQVRLTVDVDPVSVL